MFSDRLNHCESIMGLYWIILYVLLYIYLYIYTHCNTISWPSKIESHAFVAFEKGRFGDAEAESPRWALGGQAVGSLGFGDRQEVPPMVTGRDELAVVASGGCIYAMGGSHLVWPVPCCHWEDGEMGAMVILCLLLLSIGWICHCFSGKSSPYFMV